MRSLHNRQVQAGVLHYRTGSGCDAYAVGQLRTTPSYEQYPHPEPVEGRGYLVAHLNVEKDRLAVPTQFDIETIDDAVLGLFPLGDQRAAAILANG